jgi:methyl-accepting chemotaxis protein
MGEIASASSEQTKGIEQVNVAVTQMDEVTQQNAALVEQATAAAQAMSDQAESLRAAVSIFRVDAAQQAVQHTARSVRMKPARAIATSRKPAPSQSKPVTTFAKAAVSSLTAPTQPKERELQSAGADTWQTF